MTNIRLYQLSLVLYIVIVLERIWWHMYSNSELDSSAYMLLLVYGVVISYCLINIIIYNIYKNSPFYSSRCETYNKKYTSNTVLVVILISATIFILWFDIQKTLN